MSLINKRLEENPKSIFAGKQINRLKPIKYKLNGIEIRCFEGDTILSSAIANKITSAGKYRGGELALSENLSLPIYQIRKNAPANYPNLSDLLPIERTFAIDGAQFMTFKGKKYSIFSKILNKLKSKFFTSLGVNFDKNPSLTNLWHDLKTDEIQKTDLLIIGAGVAGLSAAATQIKSNKKTILIEQRAYCGGDAILFGHDANEKNEKSQNPIDIINSLKEQIKSAKNISIMTCAKAIDIEKNIAKIHIVKIKNNIAKSKIIKIEAKKIILATGCSDRLPIFAGNRLNNISTLSSNFHLAYGYAVWANDIISKTTTIFTTNNIAYHFATLASDAGVKFNKIIDSRIEVNSRFIQFAKAYGIKTQIGLKPTKANPLKNAINLQMNFTTNDFFQKSKTHIFEEISDNIIISAGWVPRLFLWHKAGGEIAPLNTDYALKAKGELNNIALAGSCAGYNSTKACIDSAKNAINIIYSKKTIDIIDKQLDPIFETEGDNLPVSLDLKNSNYPAYIENEQSLICVKKSIQNNIEIDNDKAFSLEALTNTNILDQLPKYNFAEIAKERAITPKNINYSSSISNKPKKQQKNEITKIPNYLIGRFEEKAKQVEIISTNNFLFEIGDLIYPNSDINDPLKSIGIIIDNKKNKNIALIVNSHNQKNSLVSISGLNGKKTAKIDEIYKNKP